MLRAFQPRMSKVSGQIRKGNCQVSSTAHPAFQTVNGEYMSKEMQAWSFAPATVRKACLPKKSAKIVIDSFFAVLTAMGRGEENIYRLFNGVHHLHRVYSELLPHQKVEIIEQLQNKQPEKKKTAFVGDGINDAPALARADIGVAMGGIGSDAAVEAADVVLMTGEPSKLAEAISIARKTRGIVVQNVVLALGIKAVILLLGAAGLASLWEAVFADVGVALLAVLNAMRAMR